MATEAASTRASERKDAVRTNGRGTPAKRPLPPVSIETLDALERSLLGPSAALPQPAAPIPARDLGARAGAAAKRAFDVIFALVLLLAVAPIMLWVALLVKLESPGPVFFRQRRLGKNMRPFSMLKFRTMAVNSSPAIHEQFIAELALDEVPTREGLKKLVDDPRVTGVGRVLRKLSIDELPQLLHVLSGRMSIVGPRPALEYEVPHYAPMHYRRFSVRPGLTGLWQVSGRSELGFLDMLELDVEYADGANLLTDLRIVVLTPRAAISATA
ncbi:MAG TPA: sugar transferase [Thermoleophilaceae bacterium]|nr:sugar transferase [Thermoleophilaceae bacterium]